MGLGFDKVYPLFSLIFEGRFLIQGPERFGGLGAYSYFAVPNLVMASPLFLLCVSHKCLFWIDVVFY